MLLRNRLRTPYSLVYYITMQYKKTILIDIPDSFLDIDVDEFCSKTGLSKPYYYKIKSGEKVIPERTFIHIKRSLEKTLDKYKKV